eukprot:CAMPEP_0177209526 /NCGR_PEP_ID=MMETSP0367-20130122/31066_1 /TAXON_ID=447022 ORGANISM="Scrippsiella hangoei-like, Strain SHHI-4" /NCGR_SAMPLE_ID=MMETSP0367 /ASSEMBLY_ACC=CAM_ASM_000362 /LENGTH=43 /DNA_ID= /DNA_START= /DNA_END= /DNA_ORIENTATION=
MRGGASIGRGEAKGFVPGLADTVMACHASVAPAARPPVPAGAV